MKKTICKKLLFMLVLSLVIPIASAYSPNDEVLDQSTPLGYKGYICGINNIYMAQSFKPKLPVLSKIELGLWKLENISGTFTVSIREKLYGKELVSKTVSIEEVPWQSYGDWVTIDIDDIQVTPDKTYFIVLTSDYSRVVFWIMTSYSPYWRGRPWTLGEYAIPLWLPLFVIVTKIPDLDFRTYGYNTVN